MADFSDRASACVILKVYDEGLSHFTEKRDYFFLHMR